MGAYREVVVRRRRAQRFLQVCPVPTHAVDERVEHRRSRLGLGEAGAREGHGPHCEGGVHDGVRGGVALEAHHLVQVQDLLSGLNSVARLAIRLTAIC